MTWGLVYTTFQRVMEVAVPEVSLLGMLRQYQPQAALEKIVSTTDTWAVPSAKASSGPGSEVLLSTSTVLMVL